MGPCRLVAHNGTPFIGGGELWTIRLLRALAQRGHEVEMWVRDRHIRQQVEEHGVKSEAVHLGGPLMIPEALAMSLRLQRNPPDALLLTTFKKTWLGGLAGALAGIPRIVLRIGLSSDLPRRHWTYGLAIHRSVDYVVTNSREIREEVLYDLPTFPPARVRTIWNGVTQPERRPRGALRGQLGLGPHAPLIGTVARLVYAKGQDRLIRALSGLPEVHCVLAGDGAQRAEFEALARERGVGDRVHFLGHRQDVGVVLADLDLYVVTSRVEGMSSAMLEAMGSGVPVVSTEVSGAREALEPLSDGSAPGWIVAADTASLVSAIARLLSDPDQRSRMSGAAVRRVREQFDTDARTDEWEDLLFGPATGALTRPGPIQIRDPGHSARIGGQFFEGRQRIANRHRFFRLANHGLALVGTGRVPRDQRCCVGAL